MSQLKLDKYVILVGPLTTLFVTTKLNTDPVNLPKLAILSTISFGLLGLLIYNKKKINISSILAGAIGMFSLSVVLSGLFSSSPWQLNFYGAEARNTGILFYLSLAIVLLAASQINTSKYLNKLPFAVIVVGVLNLIHAIGQANGYDFVDWKNIYNAALGTLGNPNFFAAYLGISISTIFPYLLMNFKNRKILAGSLILILSFTYAIYLSKSIQGYLVSAISCAILFGIQNERIRTSVKIKFSYWFVFIAGLFIGLLGILQKGPLSEYLYKPSVTLRGFYWQAALNMFSENILFGVGPDSYGDWYRRYRPIKSIVSPGGIDVNSNAAHNVPLDILSNLGIVAAISYLIIFAIVFTRIVRVCKNNSKLPGWKLSIIGIWIAYNLQSIISINQIGLAVWGWVTSGIILSPAFLNNEESKNIVSASKKINTKFVSNDFSNFAIGIGSAIGFALIAPAFLADHAWYSAVRGKDLKQFVAAANAQPYSARRMVDASNLLDMNGYSNEAKELNLKVTNFEPDYYYGWLLTYSNKLSTPDEKSQAKANLKRLDPLNEQWN